jgi:hypothetical protein
MRIFPPLFKQTQQWIIGFDGSALITVQGPVGGAMQNASETREDAEHEASARWERRKGEGWGEAPPAAPVALPAAPAVPPAAPTVPPAAPPTPTAPTVWIPTKAFSQPRFDALEAAAEHFKTCGACKLLDRCPEYKRLMVIYNEVCLSEESRNAHTK